MNYPFIKKLNGRPLVRLNKELYGRGLVEKAREREADAIGSVSQKNDYSYVELKTSDPQDYFDFLNFLIYLKQSS